jgi:hypothetical protein
MCMVLHYMKHNTHNKNVYKYIQTSTHKKLNVFNRPVASVKHYILEGNYTVLASNTSSELCEFSCLALCFN